MQHATEFLLQLQTMPWFSGNRPAGVRCFAETTVHGWRSCQIPREEQADFPRVAHLMGNLAVGFCQALSADRRSPEGLGAWENPTGRLDCLRASRGNTCFENPQPCFGLLLTDYYLQEAREAVKNPQVTLAYPFPACNQGKEL
jgi:hypothetical protein